MNQDRPQPLGNRQALEEASAWFVDFRAGEIDGVARRRFLRWLRRSPEHIRAYMEVSGAYARMPTQDSVPEELVAALIDRAKSRDVVVPLTRETHDPAGRGGVRVQGRLAHQPRPKVLRLTAGAIAISAIVALCAWFAFPHPPMYETQTAERRTITLEDGSQIELNAHSKVRVVFTPTRRRVELVEGEALFKVVKDPGRPFFVRSSGTIVRDVGTQFDIDHLESGTRVTVIEGRVAIQAESRIMSGEASGGKPVREERPLELSAGEQAVITPVSISIPPQPNIAAATAWTQGELEFFETPLSDVVTEFNRYSRRPLVIESPSLAGLRINGVYASTDTASLILFLRNQADIAVTQTGGEIRISRK